MFRKCLVVTMVALVVLAVPMVVLAQEGEGEEGKLPNLLEVISPHLQALLEAMLVAVVPYLAYYVKRWLAEAIRQAQQQLTREQYYMAEIIITNLVQAAEQIYERNEGDAKKEYVLQAAQRELARYGLNLDLIHLEAMIESMVRQHVKLPGQATIQPA